MRHLGVSIYAIRTPVICRGDDLPVIVADSLCAALAAEGITLTANDVVGVTESVVAKAQQNFASIHDIAADIREKFADHTVGVVFPILSRNRFLSILKGICLGARDVCVLLQLPHDEVGNPILDMSRMDELEDALGGLLSAADFRRIVGEYTHPFTGIDYISLYEQTADNVRVWLSRDPRDILKLTPHVLAAEIHGRARTAARLRKAGAETVYTLADILREPVNGSGFHPDFGVLGSNLSAGDDLKLFPRDCGAFVTAVRAAIEARTGVAPEVLIYGDGAFKDPAAGIWELADPVVSPAYTARLAGTPNEIKFKLAVDGMGAATSQEKQVAIERMIREKFDRNGLREGTTPRVLADLLGSLCDLTSGSGDKGTPVVLVKGYFDDYSSK